MQKFVVGISAILCLHIGFTAYFSTPDTAESARLRESLLRPVFFPPTAGPVSDDDIIIARSVPAETPFIEPAIAVSTVSVRDRGARPLVAQGRKTIKTIDPQFVKTVIVIPQAVPVKFSTAYTAERTEFPNTKGFAATNAADGQTAIASAKGKKADRANKRSFFAKVGSIVKFPYDGLKAVASWLK